MACLLPQDLNQRDGPGIAFHHQIPAIKLAKNASYTLIFRIFYRNYSRFKRMA